MAHEHHCARLGSTPEDYRRLGISPDQIEPREDGMRTDGGKGTFEWWYFDATLDDGSKLVIDFCTKDPIKGLGALAPFAEVQYDGLDGTHIETQTEVFIDDFNAATDTCDVRIGPNSFVGDLHTYKIHVETKEITADVTLVGEVPPWRPQTGHFLFEEDDHLYFAWLPSVPQGNVDATLTIGGQTTRIGGVGYHDHNWGNTDMMKVINNWYWGRGQAGPFTVITCFITAEKRYGFTELPIFMLARGGQIIADDSTKVSFMSSGTNPDTETGKPVSDLLTYSYADDDAGGTVTWHREKTVLRDKFVDDVSGWKHLAAKLIRYDGAYLRFTGEVGVEWTSVAGSADSATGEAIWELMYFGKTHGA